MKKRISALLLCALLILPALPAARAAFDDITDPEVSLAATSQEDGTLLIRGELVYPVDGTSLARFQAVLTPQDNMFGYTLSSVELI